jgi:hypothetical protein
MAQIEGTLTAVVEAVAAFGLCFQQCREFR